MNPHTCERCPDCGRPLPRPGKADQPIKVGGKGKGEVFLTKTRYCRDCAKDARVGRLLGYGVAEPS